MTELEQYFNRCANHDWLYEYSDDGSVWRKAKDIDKELLDEANKEPIKMEIYRAWSRHGHAPREIAKPVIEQFITWQEK